MRKKLDTSVLQGAVYLVGAGPGDPGLITVKGLHFLKRADVVMHDQLIALELLSEAKPTARIINVGKTPGGTRFPQSQIFADMVSYAKQGQLVVRLKGGDPFVFGRGWEEMSVCRRAGVTCAVIPGVTSALAVPALAGIPATLRGVSRSFAVVTAQTGDSVPQTGDGVPQTGDGVPQTGDGVPQTGDGEDTTALNFEALAGMDTIIVLMGRANLRKIVDQFLVAGCDPNTPAACIEQGTTPQQRVVAGELSMIADLADSRQLEAPIVTVIGRVARHASNWQGENETLLQGQVVLDSESSAHSPEPGGLFPVS